MDFKDRLQAALEKADMTPAELSRKTGIPEGTISCYRSGLYEPKQKRLKLIADALNVSTAYLLIGPQEEPQINTNLGGLEPVYFNIAKKAQDENIDPANIEEALEIAKYIGEKRRKEGKG